MLLLQSSREVRKGRKRRMISADGGMASVGGLAWRTGAAAAASASARAVHYCQVEVVVVLVVCRA